MGCTLVYGIGSLNTTDASYKVAETILGHTVEGFRLDKYL